MNVAKRCMNRNSEVSFWFGIVVIAQPVRLAPPAKSRISRASDEKPAHTVTRICFDLWANIMSLYVNGMLRGTVPLTEPLARINDINDWLGRPQYAVDPAYVASIDEFRIYSVALTAAQVAFSKAQGPDTTLFPRAQ